jgi:hypothetical protein
MGHLNIWWTEPNGDLAAEANGLRLAVRAPERSDGAVRFLVVRRDGDEQPQEILASGTEDDMRAAMKAAVRMAERILARPFRPD